MPDTRASDVESLAAKVSAMRQRIVELALTIAEVEDELATTLDHLAQTKPGRADELQALAAAARQHAESEREVARRHGG